MSDLLNTRRDARDTLRALLGRYGLETEVEWAYGLIGEDASPTQIVTDLQERDAFKQRFPAIEARREAGLPPISAEAYLQYEDQAIQVMRAAGLPSGFYDSPDDFANWIAKDVSTSELKDRVTSGITAYMQQPEEDRRAFQEFYGVGNDIGAAAAYFLDADKAVPALQRQVAASQLAGTATRAGYRGLTADTAEQLAMQGVTREQAQTGFGTIGQQQETFSTLAGEAEDTIGKDEQLAAVFDNNAAAAERIRRKQAQRSATFQGSGGFGATQTGVQGLDSAQR